MTPTQIDALIETHRAAFDALRFALATDFETPAQRLINRTFADIGVRRFDRSGDVWEQVTCRVNGWEYEPPPARLMERWAAY